MKRSGQWRIFFLIIIVFAVGGLILFRLFSLQILQFEYYSALAEDQHQLYEKLFPERGEIFIQDLSASKRSGYSSYFPLAINKEYQQVYLIPKDIPEGKKEEAIEKLSQLLEIDKEIISQRINKPDDPYEPLKHKLETETAEKIKELDIKGIGLAPETWRYYPNNTLASHLLGFVGISGGEKIGQYGIEGYYEDELNGQLGFISGEKDTAGYWIPSVNQELKPAENGSKLILTLDQNIQFRAEKELKYLIDWLKAEAGTIVITEPKTGAVRAMASYPDFNPNQYNQVEDINIFLNPAVQKTYEPGSVFKPITMAAGLDSKKITPQTSYQDKGQVWIGNSVIKNVDEKVYGQQNMIQVLEKSLNTGIIFVQQMIGKDVFKDYVQRFNFHKQTGIDLSSETKGNIANLFTGREINLATISFGQGITVTPVALISAISAIANEGKIMKPYLVEKIIKANGEETITEPEISAEVISPETAEELTKMMVSVVDNGFGSPAKVSGYTIAGKTGTAQVPDLEKGGYSEETIHTFVGFAPAFDPQFIILIKVDKPRGISFAADSVSPSFKRLAEYLFNYFEIPPQ